MQRRCTWSLPPPSSKPVLCSLWPHLSMPRSGVRLGMELAAQVMVGFSGPWVCTVHQACTCGPLDLFVHRKQAW